MLVTGLCPFWRPFDYELGMITVPVQVQVALALALGASEDPPIKVVHLIATLPFVIRVRIYAKSDCT